MSRSDAVVAASSASRAGDPPAWILLDTEALIDDDTHNTTTAMALTRSGEPIKVTLITAEPPRVSYFSVQCSILKQYGDNAGSEWGWRPLGPIVVYSEGDLALLHVSSDDYFIYRAGRRASLRLLPAACCDAEHLQFYPGLVAIGDGEHFAVATLHYLTTAATYELHVFRSDRGTWTKTPLELVTHVHLDYITKVVALGAGELGWVDIRQGILACDVVGESPKPRFIPLPKMLPWNQSGDRIRITSDCFRDVVVRADGSIWCAEMEECLKRIEVPDVSREDVLYDSDLLSTSQDDLTPPPPMFVYLGWRIITWNRTASSNCWRKGGLVNVDDIVADDALLRQITGGDGTGVTLTVGHLAAEAPILGLDGGDVVYIMCKAEQNDTKTWVAAVDMGKKTLKEVAPIVCQESRGFTSSYTSCALSKYLTTN